MKIKKKTAAFIAAAAVLVIIGTIIGLLLFRGGNSDEYISLGEYTITEGHYKYFITKGYDAAYAMTGVSDSSLLDQKIEGVSADRWIKDYAVKEAEKYLTANKLFDEAGLELSDEDKQAVNERFDDEWYYTGRMAVYGPMGVVEEIYGDILTTDKKIERLTDYYASELEKDVTQGQIEEYFTENYASAKYIAINYVNRDNQPTLSQFEGWRDEIEGGKSFDQLAAEIESESISYVLTSIDGETGKADVVVPKTGSLYPLGFVKELFADQIGDMIYYNDEANMIYVIAQRTDILADSRNLEQYRDEVVKALLGGLFEQRLEGEASTNKFTVNKRNTGGVDIRALYGM